MTQETEQQTSSFTLLDGRITLRQPTQGFRVAIDTVFLAAAVSARLEDRILDAGCGVGAAALCLASRLPGCRIDGVEFQRNLAKLATENITANGMSERIRVVAGDIRRPPPTLAPLSYDHVMVNPPHLEMGAYSTSPNESKALADAEKEATLADWFAFAHQMLRPKGEITLIHRADRVDDILAGLHGKFGGIEVFPLWPHAGEAARRIVVRARKGVRTPATIHAGLVLHDKEGHFTPAADAILRGAEGI